jgi:uncharacterized protein
MSAPLLGRPLWYELMTADKAAAERFYTTVVGWTTAPFDGAPQPYTMWMRGEQPVGGVMDLPDDLKQMGVPPHWMWYIGVPKLEEAAANVTRLGGKVVSPVIDVPTVGRMQMVADPQGGAFSLYEPASPPSQDETAPEVGNASWHELYTTDGAAGLKFYQDLFGWKNLETMEMGEMGKYYMFGRDSGMLGGMMTKVGEMAHLPTAWLIYFRVPDINAAAERIKSAGGKVVNGPMEVPGGDWIVQGMDPQGAMFALHAKKA